MKRGSPEALNLLGYGRSASIDVAQVRITPRRVPIGQRVSIEFVVRSLAGRTQDLLLDLRVHFVKADGGAAPKVFKLKRLTLAPSAEAAIATSVSLAMHTTRTPRPGRHTVDVIVNGRPLPLGAFHVVNKQSGRSIV